MSHLEYLKRNLTEVDAAIVDINHDISAIHAELETAKESRRQLMDDAHRLKREIAEAEERESRTAIPSEGNWWIVTPAGRRIEAMVVGKKLFIRQMKNANGDTMWWERDEGMKGWTYEPRV